MSKRKKILTELALSSPTGASLDGRQSRISKPNDRTQELVERVAEMSVVGFCGEEERGGGLAFRRLRVAKERQDFYAQRCGNFLDRVQRGMCITRFISIEFSYFSTDGLRHLFQSQASLFTNCF